MFLGHTPASVFRFITPAGFGELYEETNIIPESAMYKANCTITLALDFADIVLKIRLKGFADTAEVCVQKKTRSQDKLHLDLNC